MESAAGHDERNAARRTGTTSVVRNQPVSLMRAVPDTPDCGRKGDQMRFQLDTAGSLTIHIGEFFSIHIRSTPAQRRCRTERSQTSPATTIRLGGLLLEFGSV